MGEEIRKLLFINKVAKELMITEQLNKEKAIEKVKDMISKGEINIKNGQVYNEATGEGLIDF